MPLSIVQIVLGISFVLIWVFIGTMVLRDGTFAIRDEGESRDLNSGGQRTSPPRPHANFSGPDRRTPNRRRTSAA